MIHEHKNLHTNTPNPCVTALHIDHNQATMQQSTSAIGEVP